MKKWLFTLSIGYVRGIHKEEFTLESLGYDEELWGELDKEEQDEELQTAWDDWSGNYIDDGWEDIL